MSLVIVRFFCYFVKGSRRPFLKVTLGVNMMCLQGANKLRRLQKARASTLFLRLQVGNFMRLLEGRLCLDPARCQNFFMVRSYNRKNFFALVSREASC